MMERRFVKPTMLIVPFFLHNPLVKAIILMHISTIMYMILYYIVEKGNLGKIRIIYIEGIKNAEDN